MRLTNLLKKKFIRFKKKLTKVELYYFIFNLYIVIITNIIITKIQYLKYWKNNKK